MREQPAPDILVVRDDLSYIARFNDEKTWMEFELTRAIPSHKLRKTTAVRGIITGIHSNWVYKNLEAAADGVIDFKLEEVGERTANFMRIRSMRNVRFDSEWHRLNMGQNFEVTLEK